MRDCFDIVFGEDDEDKDLYEDKACAVKVERLAKAEEEELCQVTSCKVEICEGADDLDDLIEDLGRGENINFGVDVILEGDQPCASCEVSYILCETESGEQDNLFYLVPNSDAASDASNAFAVVGSIFGVVGILMLIGSVILKKRRNHKTTTNPTLGTELENPPIQPEMIKVASSKFPPSIKQDEVVPTGIISVINNPTAISQRNKDNFLRFSQNSASTRSELTGLLRNAFVNKDFGSIRRNISIKSTISEFSVESYKSKLSDEGVARSELFKGLSARLSQNYSRVNELLGLNDSSRAGSTIKWDKSADELVEKVYIHLKDEILSIEEVQELQKMNMIQPMNDFSAEEPEVDLQFYLSRLVNALNKWFEEEGESEVVGMRSLMFSLIYLRKLKATVQYFGLTVYNVHKLFAILLLVAAKFTEDYLISNEYWADVCGIPMEELNILEESFCFSSEFNFFVTPEELEVVAEEFGFENIGSNSLEGDSISE